MGCGLGYDRAMEHWNLDVKEPWWMARELGIEMIASTRRCEIHARFVRAGTGCTGVRLELERRWLAFAPRTDKTTESNVLGSQKWI